MTESSRDMLARLNPTMRAAMQRQMDAKGKPPVSLSDLSPTQQALLTRIFPPLVTAGSVTITVNLPDKLLSPNARPHHMAKARATREARLETCLHARPFGSRELRWTTARVDLYFYFKDPRKRDRQNLIASTKAHIDGLVDAGLLIDDSEITFGPVQKLIDKHNPRLEIVVTRTA